MEVKGASATGSSIGQLISMDWSFGVAVKSSACTLNSPFVRLHLRVLDNNGKVEDQNLELDLNEFQVSAFLLKSFAQQSCRSFPIS
jgi:hypothetical protein